MFTEKWDLTFLKIADDVAQLSKDPSTKCGAVIVRPDKTIVSTGFNGFPKRMPDKPEWYANREEKYSRVVHCEMNAVLHAYERLEGCVLYTTGASCDRCAVHMIQAGIIHFVAWIAPAMWERWGDSFRKTFGYYDVCGVTHHEYEK